MANQHALILSDVVSMKPFAGVRQPADAAPSTRGQGAVVVMIAFWMIALLGSTSQSSAQLLELGFAPAAVLLGFALWRKSPAAYLSFVWQLFFLASFVRRLADYQLGWNPTNPIVIAPYATAAWCGFTLMRPRRAFLTEFGWIAAGLGWALAIGVVRNGIPAGGFAMLEWGAGPLIAGYLLTVSETNSIAASLRATAIVSVMVMAFYGIAQYLAPASWDLNWIVNAHMASAIGLEPGSLRVFSTMNSPWPFAMTLMGLLVFVIGCRGWVSSRGLAVVAGSVVLIASQTRAAWGGLVIGWVFLVLIAGRARSRLLGAAALLALIAGLAVVAMPSGTSALTHRISTLSSLSADDSFAVRVRFYMTFVGEAFSQPMGAGLGRTGVATRLSDDASMLHFDSGLMIVPFMLGWVGAAGYVGGLGTLCIVVARRWRRLSVIGQAAAAACVGLLSQMLFLNSLVAAAGVIFWTMLGYCLMELRDDQPAAAISRLKSFAGK